MACSLWVSSLLGPALPRHRASVSPLQPIVGHDSSPHLLVYVPDTHVSMSHLHMLLHVAQQHADVVGGC